MEQFAQSEDELPEILALLSQRSWELGFQTMAVGLRASSTLSATIRMPPALNRTAKLIEHFVQHYRSADYPPPKKTARVFRTIQNELLKTVSSALFDLILEAR